MQFIFDKNTIRTVEIEGKTFYIVKDICKALGLKNSTQAIRPISDEWKKIIQYNSSRTNIVSEAGMYKIILNTNKPTTEFFINWLCEDALPAINNNDEYIFHDDKKPSKKDIKEKTKYLKFISKIKNTLENEIKILKKN